MPLEPIQEESERDETQGSKTWESEESCETPVDTEEVMEEEDELRVLRPRRLSRSSSQGDFVQMTTTENHMEETDSSSVSSFAEDVRDEAITIEPNMVGRKIHFSRRDWKLKVSGGFFPHF